MRSEILTGAVVLALVFPHDADARHALGDANARTTHTDPRAVQGASFVADVTALCLGAESGASRADLVKRATAPRIAWSLIGGATP